MISHRSCSARTDCLQAVAFFTQVPLYSDAPGFQVAGALLSRRSLGTPRVPAAEIEWGEPEFGYNVRPGEWLRNQNAKSPSP